MNSKAIATKKAKACREYLDMVDAVTADNEAFNRPLRIKILDANTAGKKRLRKKIREFNTAQRIECIEEIEYKYNVKILEIIL